MSSSFDDAAAYLSNGTVPNVSSTVKLELYGLFKYVTVETKPVSPRPSIFDMTGRAKWDAWTAAGNTYTTKTDAESRYLEIARSLGWTQGVTQELEGATGSSGESGGFGTSVSAMARPEDDNDTSLHGLAVSNDLQGLKELLEREPNVDVRDESSGCTPLHLAADRGHKASLNFCWRKVPTGHSRTKTQTMA
ncbi:acyl CoA binding protein-domain-containing protein [Mycena galopus ATCC 62051]|nr:acyl CoA binding protein-domain-containing protein [Mycena galopus ATCC 62051]